MIKTKRKMRQWSQEDVNTALERLQKGELSIRKASRMYNIPKTTLSDKLNFRTPVVTKEGRVPYLTPEEETAIMKWTIHMNRLGFGPTKRDIEEVVKQVLDKDSRKTPFKDNRPGSKWFSLFLSRNPGVVVRREKPVSRKKAAVPPSVMDTWFDDFAEYLEESQAEAILNEPMRLYKCEESTFELDDLSAPRRRKGDKAKVGDAVKVPKYTQVTVLLAVCADGSVPPPLVVVPSRKSLGPRSRMDGALKGAVLAGTQNGVMDASAFLEFLKNIFQPFLIQKKVPHPVLLFVNEHSKCKSLEVSCFCQEHDILLYQGPPHAAYECQLSKLFVAECLEVKWGFVQKAHKVHNPGCHVTKKSLPSIIYEAWTKLKGRPSVGIDEFKAIGVYPFTRVYNPSKTSPSTASATKDLTASTSKESLSRGRDDSGAATGLAPVAHPSLEGEIEAAVSSLSVSATSLDSSTNATVTIPGKAPIQVSPMTTMLLSRVVGILEQDGNITFHMDKQCQSDELHSSRVKGSLTGVKQRQVPEELWDEFLQFMVKKKKKEEKKAMKKKEWERALKEKRLKKHMKEKALKKALREKELEKERIRGKKRKRNEAEEEESIKKKQEKGMARTVGSMARTRGGKTKRNALRRDDSDEDDSHDEDTDSDDNNDDSSDEDGENICIECDQGGDGNGWIGCNSCTSWLHLDCSDLFGLTLEDVQEIPYKCKYCR